jgi:hypothetical protein
MFWEREAVYRGASPLGGNQCHNGTQALVLNENLFAEFVQYVDYVLFVSLS